MSSPQEPSENTQAKPLRPRDLESRLGECLAAHRHDFDKRIRGLKRRAKSGKPIDIGLGKLAAEMDKSRKLKRHRLEARPHPKRPEELPITERWDEIVETIRKHQVIVLAGETGSGKSTQIPKICLDAGRGIDGFIGCTQPRRIAARSVAARVAEEMDSQLGALVGFKVRFQDRTDPGAYIKFMTDGILLAEIQTDRWLNGYDTLIIDEAHERSLNIDFLLGYLKQLLAKRPDLKLIITSATINTERFSEHFDGAPIIEVSGRTYPVETRYRPLVSEDEDERDRDQTQAIIDAVDELTLEDSMGDTLIFLPGEREIRETAEAISNHLGDGRAGRMTQVLPLFARQSSAEQDRIFHPGPKRRIVLATNVAETSLTVPRIRFVIDPGFARISRYSVRHKVQRLPIEPVSQASANQRKGRCGRVSDGICIRLFSEDDFNSRAEFTDPEIRRTSLADVILRMKSLRLGEVEDFPFVEPPDSRAINDGYRQLQELGAAGADREITAVGRDISRLPIDSRIARMVLEAKRRGALREVMVIASALSVQDPRVKPMEKRQAADEKHRQWNHEDSDFLSYWNLWTWYEEQRAALSGSQFRKLCKSHYLAWMRMQEWRDIHRQLQDQVKDLGWKLNDNPASYDAVHRSLITGLLGNLGFKEEKNQYLGARNTKFSIFPVSGLNKKQPKWIMAGELIETSKLFAHTVAKIQPEWAEEAGSALLKRSYSEPHWEKKSAQVAAFERVTLYGLTLAAQRKINFGPIKPAEARDIFIHGALVEGEFDTKAHFFRHNRKLVQEIEELEARSRRRDILVDDQAIFDFYDERIPAAIHSGAGFEKWRKQAEKEDPHILHLDRATLLQEEEHGVSEKDFPRSMTIGGLQLKLRYHFDPGHAVDGVTVQVPLPALNLLEPEPFDWLVPGLLKEKIIALIRALPKALRKNFVPAPNFADACYNSIDQAQGSLKAAVAHQLKRMTGVAIQADAWDEAVIPDHLLMNFRIIDDNGRTVAEGRDLAELQGRAGHKAKESFRALPEAGIEQTGISRWDFGDLDEQIDIQRKGLTIHGYPALVDKGDSCAIEMFDHREQAEAAHVLGLIRLFALSEAQKAKYLREKFPVTDSICLRLRADRKQCDAMKRAFVDRCMAVALDVTGERGRIFTEVRTEQAWKRRTDQARTDLVRVANDTAAILDEIQQAYHQVRCALDKASSPAWLHAVADMRDQLDHLVYPGFLVHTPVQWLPRIPVYLKAMDQRMEKLRLDPNKDRSPLMDAKAAWEKWKNLPEAKREQKTEYRWLVEEYRVSLWAQTLKTVVPVSPKRLRAVWETDR